MLVYLRDGSAQTVLRAATLRQKLQIRLSTSPSHSIPTPGQPVPAMTLRRQAPGWVATGVPIWKPMVRLDPEKSRTKRDSNTGSSALETDALTTRPTRRLAVIGCRPPEAEGGWGGGRLGDRTLHCPVES